MQPITAAEARQIADKWVADSAPPGPSLIAMLHEFDQGYVVWARPPDRGRALAGAARGIIDRETGELSIWPTLPIAEVISDFRRRRLTYPPAPRTADPAAQIRRDLARGPTPARVAHLTLSDRVVVARSVKGDDPPRHHPVVAQFLGTVDPRVAHRGFDRCAEAAAISDALYATDTSPADTTTAADGRERLVGATLVTYQVLEAGDPAAGHVVPPCPTCAALCAGLGVVSQ